MVLLLLSSYPTAQILSPDYKKIITADRDEKIRICKFPNAYDIICFCLGHRRFSFWKYLLMFDSYATCLAILPSFPNFLVSAGTDGTIRVWDVNQGQNVFTFTLSVLSWKGKLLTFLGSKGKPGGCSHSHRQAEPVFGCLVRKVNLWMIQNPIYPGLLICSCCR
jgi:WD40 repeat protein